MNFRLNPRIDQTAKKVLRRWRPLGSRATVRWWRTAITLLGCVVILFQIVRPSGLRGAATERGIHTNVGVTPAASAATTVSVSPGSLSFVEGLGGTSFPQNITLTNTGSAPLILRRVLPVSQFVFSQTNTCGTSLPALASCTIAIRFKPSGLGARRGLVFIMDSASPTPTQIVRLSAQGVPNRPPVANAGGPYTGKTGHSITFSASGSTDPDDNPLTFTWSFGDGSTGTGVSPTHTYTKAGTYTVMVTANDGLGGTNTASTTATITTTGVTAPTLTAVSPSTVIVGTFTLDLMGTGFVTGAQVFFGTTPLTTTFDSATELMATGTATPPQVGVVPVTVTNTGTSHSNAINVTVLAASSGSSGSTGVLAGHVGGVLVDKAYVPTPASQSVAVLNADATTTTSAFVKSIAMPSGYTPNVTAANQATSQVIVTSYTSPDVQIIDATTDTLINTLTSPATGTAGFSGGSCTICGALIDQSTNTAILDTANGYFLLNLTTKKFSSAIAPLAAENFAFNPNTRIILSPTYDVSPLSGLQTIRLTDGLIANYTTSVGNTPDAAAVDLGTNIVAIPDEFTGNQYLVNMAAATFDTTTSPPSVSAPSTVFPINFTDCGVERNDWSLVSAETSSHLLFVATEFADCAAVEPLPSSPITGAPPAVTAFHWGHMPNAPDSSVWDSGGDPHGIAVFTSVVSSKPYGFLIDFNQLWVARLDLKGIQGAPLMPGGTGGEVDLTPFVTFLKTSP